MSAPASDCTDLGRSVVRSHRAAHGEDPAGVWSAPGRVNLIGEFSDLYRGLALPMALPHRTYVAASPRADRRLHLRSTWQDVEVTVALDEIGPGHPSGWGAYVAGVAWALGEEGERVGGANLTIESTVPVGAGLSSSAALSCAAGAAMGDLYGLFLLDSDEGRSALARAATRGENVVAGAPTGGMDQLTSLFAQPGRALLIDFADDSRTQVPLNLNGYEIVVTDTRARHALVDGGYAQRRAVTEAALGFLGLDSARGIAVEELPVTLGRLADDESRRRLRHAATESGRVRGFVAALAAGDISRAGNLLNESHASLRDDYEVSCPELDVAVVAARESGAVGARMTGGGFGGSTVSLVPNGVVADVAQGIERAFTDRGWATPHTFVARASAGARREF